MTHAKPVETSVWIPATPDEAFGLVTDPARLRRWLIVAGTMDVSVGGNVHLVVAPGAHAAGKVTVVEPGRRFAYTHGWVNDEQMPPGVDLSGDPAGTRSRRNPGYREAPRTSRRIRRYGAGLVRFP